MQSRHGLRLGVASERRESQTRRIIRALAANCAFMRYTEKS